MGDYSEYSDEEIHSLLRQITAAQKQAEASQEKPAETTPKQGKTSLELGLRPDLSIDEILKKMQTEIADR